jgi:hypothetical protein
MAKSYAHAADFRAALRVFALFEASASPLLPARRRGYLVHQRVSASRGLLQVKALVTDKLPSIGGVLEYPSDHFIGICIEATAMAEHNSLRLP